MSQDQTTPEDFAVAFDAAAERLRATVQGACPPEVEWPERVAAAIYAVLDFAVADPAAICVLTRDALLQRPAGADRLLELTAEFAAQLRALVPRDPRLPDSTEQALIGAVAMTIAEHLRGARLDRLREAGPQLVELSLRPYLGREQARRAARALPG
jgi:hypothetical protein